jgi:hypothetical protein
MDNTIFLNARSTANAYSPKITTQCGTCPDKAVIRYLYVTNDCCLRMDIGGFGDFRNLIFKFVDRHEEVSFLSFLIGVYQIIVKNQREGVLTFSSGEKNEIDTFDRAEPRFLNRGKKRRSVSTLSIPRA